MFIAKQQQYIPAPAEPNVVAVHMALPWSADHYGGGAINIWPLRGQIPPTNTLLTHHDVIHHNSHSNVFESEFNLLANKI